MNLFGGSNGATAPYPRTDYPATSFFGPASLQAKGGNADGNIAPQNKTHTVLVIVGLVILGYLLWHFNYKA